MAVNYKVLGQSNPPASGLTTLYIVPSGTQAVCSSLSVCNIGGVSSTYRVAVRPSGEEINNKHYISYDSEIAASGCFFLKLGLSLSATDVVSVYTPSNSGVAFNLFGTEIT